MTGEPRIDFAFIGFFDIPRGMRRSIGSIGMEHGRLYGSGPDIGKVLVQNICSELNNGTLKSWGPYTRME